MTKFLNFIKSGKQAIVITAPPASGKTSLLQSFLHEKPVNDAIYCYVKMDSELDPFKQLADQANIRRDAEKWKFPAEWRRRKVFLMIDDAETIYNRKDFWLTLLKSPGDSLPNNFILVIACTYALSDPIQFSDCRTKIEFPDFLLSKTESRQLILNERTGLKPPTNGYPNLHERIVHDCSGQIGSLRMIIDAINRKNCDDSLNTEQKAMQFFSSLDPTYTYNRCWSCDMREGWQDSIGNDMKKLLVDGQLPLSRTLSASVFLNQLIRSGILMISEDGYSIRFTSVLSKNYFSRSFPIQ
jgi:hypothetical protein